MVARRRGRNRSQSGPYGSVSDAYRKQSDLIVQCARKCFETKGVKKTTLTDIAREADLTRELLYYYFSNKQEIAECLIDSYVQDAVETTRLWCDTWADEARDGKGVLSREAIADLVASIRRFVFSCDGSRRSMFAVLNEMNQRQIVFSRMCTESLRAVADNPTLRACANTFPQFAACDRELLFKFVVLGVIGLMEGADARDDWQIVDVLMMSATAKPLTAA